MKWKELKEKEKRFVTSGGEGGVGRNYLKDKGVTGEGGVRRKYLKDERVTGMGGGVGTSGYKLTYSYRKWSIKV